jgi:predicted DNA-binding transcriptional regulator YafY
VVQLAGRWYLVAFDPQRDDWRSFRLDRLQFSQPAGARFSPRTTPGPAALLESMAAVFRRHRATVIVAAAAGTVASRLPSSVPVEAVDAGHCRVFASGDTAYRLAMNLLMLDQEFVLEDTSPAVRAALRTISQRAARAGSPARPPA